VSERTLEELRHEIIEFRKELDHLGKLLALKLSAALLCKATFDLPPSEHSGSDRKDAERLTQEAEECFRCARLPGLKKEIAEGLEIAGHELMAKAVKIETKLQREHRNGEPNSK
jgi:hypothetical protein